MVKQKAKATKPAKKRQGRPSLSGAKVATGERSPFVGVRLAPDDLDTLDTIAAREGVKRSEMVRRLITTGMAAYKPGKGSK